MDRIKLEEIISSICINAGYELVELEIVQSKKADKMIIYIDNCGNVTIDDCINVNNLVNQFPEVDNFFENEYTLEVSSPGPKRPLKTQNDFERYKGKKVKIVSLTSEDGKSVFSGMLEDINNKSVMVNDSGKLYEISLSDIKKANLNM